MILSCRSVGVSKFDVNTKQRHDTPVKVDVVLPDGYKPYVAQMKFYTTKLNASVIVLNIQGNLTNNMYRVLTC